MEEIYQNETTENQETEEILETMGSSVTFEAGQPTLQHMISMAKWGKFMAIMTYIGMAFVLLAAVMMFCLPNVLYPDTPGLSTVTGIVYLIMGIIYLFPATYLYKGSKSMLAAGTTHDSGDFADAMKFNKKYWKFYGIFTIVTISLAILACIAAIIFAVAMASSASETLFDMGEAASGLY